MADAAVELDGSSLPSCEGAAEGADCVDENLGLIRLYGVGEATLAIGDGTVDLSSDEAVDLTVGFAEAAWEEWADPTTLENLDSDAPSYCEGAPEK